MDVPNKLNRVFTALDDYIHEQIEEGMMFILLQMREDLKDDVLYDTLITHVDNYCHNLFDLEEKSKVKKERKKKEPDLESETEEFSPNHKPLNPNSCSALLKSGPNKGKQCTLIIVEGTTLCKRHQPKAPKCESFEVCSHPMKSGVRAGQPCGAKAMYGEKVCGKHKIVKCIHQTGRKKCGRPISKFSSSETFCRVHIIEELNIDTSKVILRKTKFGHKEHKYSELLFEEGKAIGKLTVDGGITKSLNDDDLECVKVYNLPLADEHIPKMKEYLGIAPSKPPDDLGHVFFESS